MKPHKVLIAVAAASAALATTMSTASAKDELGAVTALQLTNTIAKSFVRNYLEAANQAKGPVKIKYVGGQEVVPPRKAANALKRGQFDLLSSISSRPTNGSRARSRSNISAARRSCPRARPSPR
jgi:TRAP-type C4-dicarboxylate transport system substrate-binding protein